MEDKKLESLPVSDAVTTETQPNELHEKQIFTDIFSEPTLEETENPTDTDLPQPAFYDRVVLDEDYAERHAPAPIQADLSPARQAASARRDFDVSRPRARKTRLAPSRPLFSTRLSSGEMPSDAMRRIVRELGALLLFCLVVGGAFGIKEFVSNFLTDNAYDSMAKSTLYSDPVSCRGFSVEATDLLDGYVLAQAVSTKAGSPITDASVFEKADNDTIFPTEIVSCMESALPADRVFLKENISNLDLLIQIHESLRDNLPVIVLISDASAADFTLQYVAVTKMDVEADRITVENPNVGTQEYTFEEFIAATRFQNFEDMPYQMKLALTFGTWSPNTAIFVD